VTSRVEIKLVPGVVDPLIEFLREETKRLSSLDDATVSSRDICELDSFLNLFSDAYRQTATITIDRSRAPTYVRACAYACLQLRARHLASIDNKVLETSLNHEDYTGDLQRGVLCYSFLCTIQETVLTHVGILSVSRFECGFPFRTIAAMIARRCAEKDPLKSSHADSSLRDGTEVVVLNDPVNTMAYVTAVFRHVIGLSAERAKQRMTEVHERQSSVVWIGEKERAERYAEELRLWHLIAECRPVPASKG
jgi:ATP-dependent Clp protease adapter protein ClpS